MRIYNAQFGSDKVRDRVQHGTHLQKWLQIKSISARRFSVSTSMTKSNTHNWYQENLLVPEKRNTVVNYMTFCFGNV